MASIEKVQNSVTPQMTIDMVACYEAGASIREVAAAFSVHRQTAARHLRSAGAEPRKPGLSIDQFSEARNLYLSGLTLLQVSQRFGVSQGTVGRALRAQGTSLRPPLVRARQVST